MIIKTYLELEEFVEMFRRQNADLIIIKSRAGLGKTSLLKKKMGSRKNWVYANTHSTPLKTYLELHDKIDLPVVFDDIDSILSNPIMISLLKSLADTSQIKELHYHSTTKLLKDVPESFETKSNCCLLLNDFDTRNTTLLPLIDRAFFLDFRPSREEILEKMREINKERFKNNEVFGFIEANYKVIREDDFTLRIFVKGVQLYQDNLQKWKERFMEMVEFDEKLILYIQLQEKYPTQNERLSHWKWSRGTYFNISRKYKSIRDNEKCKQNGK